MLIKQMIESLEKNNVDKHLIFIVKNNKKTNYTLYQVDIDDEIRYSLFQIVKNQLNEHKDKECKDYQIFGSNDEIYSFDNNKLNDDFRTKILQNLSNNIDEVYGGMNELQKTKQQLFGYVIILTVDNTTKIYAFRKILSSKVLYDSKRKNVLKMMFDTNGAKMKIDHNEQYVIDENIDFIVNDNETLIFNKYYFEQIVGMKEVFVQTAMNYVQKLVSNNLLVDAEKLGEYISKDKNLQKKVAFLDKIQISENIDALTINRIEDVKSKKNLQIQFKNGKFTVNSKNDAEELCKILGDYYKIGEISTKSYGLFVEPEKI